MNKSIRIRTKPGEDKNIQVKVEQDFDVLEILSLKISQEDLYNTFCADYGVVVGRVIANKGFGVPNAKVSVFVPISSEDEKNDLIKDLYPFKTVSSKDSNNIRYNLLLSKATCELNKAVGTFPTKEQVVNNEIMIEVFDKYYKYTTRTNDSGDYMIFGVPTGQQTVHMDVDLSDVGTFSLRPYDLIDSGYPEQLFESRVEFKESTDLDSLPQIKSGNKGIDVIPFWGDGEKCQIGITRVDFDTNFEFKPSAILMGSLIGDNGKMGINQNCKPSNQQGDHNSLSTGPGTIEVIRVDSYTYEEYQTENPKFPDYGNSTQTKVRVKPLSLEKFNLPQGPTSIDDNGAFTVTVPMNLAHVITDEFGNLVPSLDPEIGIPTKGMYRFKVKFLEPSSGPKLRTAQAIFPSLNRNTGGDKVDINGQQNATENVRWTDSITTWFNSDGEISDGIYKDFHTFQFNQIYSVSQYITKYRKGFNRFSFLGLKNVDNSNFNVIPFNNVVKKFDFLYVLLKLFITLQAALMRLLVSIVNFRLILCIGIFINFKVLKVSVNLTVFPATAAGFAPFGFLKGLTFGGINLTCESDQSFPYEIDSWKCGGSVKSDKEICFGSSSEKKTRIALVAAVPKRKAEAGGEDGDNPFLFNCEKLDILYAWECCAKYDLAIQRNILRFTFSDSWLTGSIYMPQFQYKVKNNGKVRFCGVGATKEGTGGVVGTIFNGNYNFRQQKCCDRGGGNFKENNNIGRYCDKCVVRGPDKGSSGGAYRDNRYKTGASDTGDLVYCPESLPIKIVNLGRTDACFDVLDKINRCISSQECLLDFYTTSPCSDTNSGRGNCLIGTNYSDGYDTAQWVNEIGVTTYQDPAAVLLALMKDCKKGPDGLFRSDCGKIFNFDKKCNECECEDEVYKQLRYVSRLYSDIILTEDVSTGSDFVPVRWTGFDFDTRQTPRFNPTNPGGLDNDPEIGDNQFANHLANIPYFYFGLIPGSSAIDKLRKDFLVNK